MNVVFGGGFTWDDYGDEEGPDGSHHREIDIGEDSRWGQPGIPNTQNVKHPYKFGPANEHRFHLPDLSGDARLTRILVWRPESLRFVTVRGHYAAFDFPAERGRARVHLHARSRVRALRHDTRA